MNQNDHQHDAEALGSLSPVRQKLAALIGLATAVGTLYALWLIVPFFQGHAESPLVAEWNYLAPVTLQLNGSLDAVHDWGLAGMSRWFLFYWLGLMGYVFAAGAIMATGNQIERIVLVGWAEYLKERQSAIEAEARDARLEAARERRREQRLARVRAARVKDEGTTVALAVGAIVAVWLFWS
ncbi:hypothetical protein GO285_01418 [Ralstonia solanacearum]|nr:hypothetical protein [Ralstonia solanacearum]NKG09653.1 hypothetical protein [Ralstonia solanacearum]